MPVSNLYVTFLWFVSVDTPKEPCDANLKLDLPVTMQYYRLLISDETLNAVRQTQLKKTGAEFAGQPPYYKHKLHK